MGDDEALGRKICRKREIVCVINDIFKRILIEVGEFIENVIIGFDINVAILINNPIASGHDDDLFDRFIRVETAEILLIGFVVAMIISRDDAARRRIGIALVVDAVAD